MSERMIPAQQSKRPQNIRHSPPPGKKVLIVDDNPSMLLMLLYVLREKGYDVDVARNGLEGLQKFRGGSWDAVVTDQEMPDMDGEQMTAEIKLVAPQTPVILVTGVLDKVSRHTLFERIYQKPYTGEIICGALSEVLAGSRSETPSQEREFE